MVKRLSSSFQARSTLGNVLLVLGIGIGAALEPALAAPLVDPLTHAADPALAQPHPCEDHLQPAAITRAAGSTACAVPALSGLIGWLTGDDPMAPKVFNWSREARGGDIISIQGANFDATTVVYQDDGEGAAAPLPIVTRVGATWVAVQLPPTLRNPEVLRLKNGHGTSLALPLNAAQPWHVDATRLVPGGAFRLFGRSLKIEGTTPRVMVDGQAAGVDVSASDDSMLAVTVPKTAQPTARAIITIDNGNGTGPVPLPVAPPIEAGDGDPLGLGVGWAAAFTFVNHVIDARAACDGTTDDAPVIAEAVRQAVREGGGVVKLPAGMCRIAGTIDLASRVILRGAGQTKTILRYEHAVPLYAEGFDLVGVQDLQLRNAGDVQEGAVWKTNTRSVIQRVTLSMGVTRQWFLTFNRDFVFDHNVITQDGSYDEQNPYRFDHSAGLVFSNNETRNVSGSPTFQFVHDSVFLKNHFTRDARSQDEQPVIAHHQLVIDFCYRLAIVGNTFDIVNGPITNTLRNDGETILVEGGGPFRTEGVGTVGSAAETSLTDPKTAINVDPAGTGLLENYGVAIVSGTGSGQARRVTAYDKSTLTVEPKWDVVPDATSHYTTFLWGLENVLIKGNILRDNPRGIWLYCSSIRDVAVVGNQIFEGGGIYLRSFQKLQDKLFNLQMNTIVTDNSVVNTTGRWMSYIMVTDVRSDPLAFGTGDIGIEVRRNRIVANRPNVTSQLEEYASREGFTALVHAEGGAGRLSAIPEMLGPIFQHNSCDHCEQAYVIGTGVYGPVVADNKPALEQANTLVDLRMFENRAGASISAFIR